MEETLSAINSTWSRFHIFVETLTRDVNEPFHGVFQSASAAFTHSISSISSAAVESFSSAAAAASSSFAADSATQMAADVAASASAYRESASSFWAWALSVSDPRVAEWPLMGSPWPTIFLTLSYLLIVAVGPKLMENRKALDLRWLMVSYNLSMVVLCAYIGTQITIGALRRNYNWICQPVVHDSHPEEIRIAAGLWWFYVSKAIEFLDTFIFILRKKSSQVTFLHVYHHATMFFFWWIGIKWVASGQTFFGPIINSIVHSVMYTYYGLAAIPSMRRHLWWKKYMTWLQFIQFGIGLVWGGNTIRLNCGVPRWMQLASLVYGISIISLFVNYYMQTYHRGSWKQIKIKIFGRLGLAEKAE